MSDEISAESIIEYWYSDRIKKHWFNSTNKLDQEIKDNYETLWKNTIRGEYNVWKQSAEGCLALAIIFDQFPLNMFRGELKSFSTEAMAIKVAKHAVEKGFDEKINKDQISFLYMPLMHSENIEDQDLSVSLFEKAGLTENVKFAKHHQDIVKKFGRFPHRNEILNRQSSEQELEYLNSKEAFKG